MKKYTIEEIHTAVGCYADTLANMESLKVLLKAARKTLKEPPFDSPFKIGEEVIIIRRDCGHSFKIGERVRVISIGKEGTDSYKVTDLNKNDFWWVHISEISSTNP